MSVGTRPYLGRLRKAKLVPILLLDASPMSSARMPPEPCEEGRGRHQDCAWDESARRREDSIKTALVTSQRGDEKAASRLCS